MGAVAYYQLPVSALPQVDYPTIQVITFYPGASPDVMASSITAPLERQFGQVPGLNQMTSTSSAGSSVITLQFALDLNIDVAAAGCSGGHQRGHRPFCRRDLPNPPIYSKINPADAPILTLALTSKTLPLVQSRGSGRYAPGPEDLAVAWRGAGEYQRRPKAGGAHSGQPDGAVSLRAEAGRPAHGDCARPTSIRPRAASTAAVRPLRSGPTISSCPASEYRPLIIAYRNGAPVRLSDVADVIDDAENVQQAAWMNDVPAVILNIQRQPGANIIEVADRVKALLPKLKASLPAVGGDRPF